mmetsp:Transcript_22638/g.31606  ORF Transcript_22638/g.31606 Transcript_22638/m.31606 type:complete len:158 (+) Transcript_22638:855-1328(+)
MPKPNVKIEHITEIQAPIEKVWGVLVDIQDWKWNKWTRLKAEKAEEGVQGKLEYSVDGNEKWETADFTFGGVDNYSLTWFGSLGPTGCLFHGYHTMKLEPIKNTGDFTSPQTKLIHTENFSGILPRLSLGLPYDKLDRNYLLINEALKKFVEEGNNE